MAAAITDANRITSSVISAFGVRSWNATDSASSVSDKYNSTSNHNTFRGTVIGIGSFLRELKSHLAVAVRIVAPVFAYLHVQEQMHAGADDFGKLFARIRA